MGKFYQSIQSYGPSFMTKFCSALYLENLLTNIFAKFLHGGVSCMPAALLLNFFLCDYIARVSIPIIHCICINRVCSHSRNRIINVCIYLLIDRNARISGKQSDE